jgi:hypothetical protein
MRAEFIRFSLPRPGRPGGCALRAGSFFFLSLLIGEKGNHKVVDEGLFDTWAAWHIGSACPVCIAQGSRVESIAFSRVRKCPAEEVQKVWIDLSLALCETPRYISHSEHAMVIARKPI